MMNREVYVIDPAITPYVEQPRERNEDPIVYHFFAKAKDVACLRNPRCLVVSKNGRWQWTVESLQRVPGPPVDQKLEWALALQLKQVTPV